MASIEHSSSIVVFRDQLAGASDGDGVAVSDGDWRNYCEKRAASERAAAKSATCTIARRRHQELAQLYSDMLRRNRAK